MSSKHHHRKTNIDKTDCENDSIILLDNSILCKLNGYPGEKGKRGYDGIKGEQGEKGSRGYDG